MTSFDSRTERQMQDLSARLREAEAACAAKDSFIAAISRELNNPLAPVLLAVEHLRALLPAGDVGRLEAAMQMLERATGGFARRTQVLLAFADLVAGVAPFPTASVDVSALVAAAAGPHIAEMARLASCTVVLDVAPQLVAVANAEALNHVLGHILANAFRFGAGRPVRVSARHDAGAVVITITDQGPGIDAVRAARLFALFQQARAPLEPGLGIGMWVSAQLVAAMGGTIGVQTSKGGSGAHFHVSLPSPQTPLVAPHAQTLQTHPEPGMS